MTRTACAVPRGAVLPEDPSVRVAFSGRADGNVSLVVGDGDVAANRERLLGAVGAAPGDAVFMEQVHGATVGVVGSGDAGRGATVHAQAVGSTDALVTRDLDVALVVLVADCVPVVLADPGEAVAVVHAGRRGVEQQIVARAVEELTTAPDRAVALVGPAIGGCCYEVEAEVRDAVAAGRREAASTTTWGTPSLDLPTAVQGQLRDAGVATVRRTGGCTRCEPGTWFSHRATTDPSVAAPAGRSAAVVVRRSGAGHFIESP